MLLVVFCEDSLVTSTSDSWEILNSEVTTASVTSPPPCWLVMFSDWPRCFLFFREVSAWSPGDVCTPTLQRGPHFCGNIPPTFSLPPIFQPRPSASGTPNSVTGLVMSAARLPMTRHTGSAPWGAHMREDALDHFAPKLVKWSNKMKFRACELTLRKSVQNLSCSDNLCVTVLQCVIDWAPAWWLDIGYWMCLPGGWILSIGRWKEGKGVQEMVDHLGSILQRHRLVVIVYNINMDKAFYSYFFFFIKNLFSSWPWVTFFHSYIEVLCCTDTAGGSAVGFNIACLDRMIFLSSIKNENLHWMTTAKITRQKLIITAPGCISLDTSNSFWVASKAISFTFAHSASFFLPRDVIYHYRQLDGRSNFTASCLHSILTICDWLVIGVFFP